MFPAHLGCPRPHHTTTRCLRQFHLQRQPRQLLQRSNYLFILRFQYIRLDQRNHRLQQFGLIHLCLLLKRKHVVGHV